MLLLRYLLRDWLLFDRLDPVLFLGGSLLVVAVAADSGGSGGGGGAETVVVLVGSAGTTAWHA